ncbi:hypothetical protein LOAG_16190 [Loa loa]|uniref:Uncharacterized protein n=1 Tax=Loa loa TaxID=7209 RepID=A0A1S0TEE4_LOALO|nr:hypothetical protein LOAG_16190 [Loa loa]EFO12343.2 hypothetical protein LOAG_16190 [Loa loa]
MLQKSVYGSIATTYAHGKNKKLDIVRLDLNGWMNIDLMICSENYVLHYSFLFSL